MIVSSSNFPRPFLKSLTSLRFFASFLISVLHSRNHDLISDSFLGTFDLSKSVTFFFVLSGFILCYANFGKPVSKFNFYLARFSRVFPAALLSIFFVLIILPRNVYLPGDSVSLWKFCSTLLISVLGLQAWIPIPAVFFAFNAVLWSISVEIFFYFCYPLLHKLSIKSLFSLLVIACAFSFFFVFCISLFSMPGFSSSTLNNFVWEGFIYINPLLRLPEFILGVFVCRLFFSPLYFTCLGILNRRNLPSRNFLSAISASISFFSIVFLAYTGFQPGFNQQIDLLISTWYSALLFSLLIVLMASCQVFLLQFLDWPLFVFLGEISYGVYLYHQPLMVRVSQLDGFKFAGIQIMPQNFPGLLTLTIALSALSFVYFEVPFNRYIRNSFLAKS